MWHPLAVDDVSELFADAPFRWWLTGGRALELHLGTSWRAHSDTDVGIPRADAAQVFAYLDDWELWVAATGELRAWSSPDWSPNAGSSSTAGSPPSTPGAWGP